MQQRSPGEFLAAIREAKKIAVVDLGFLGDTIHLIPSLWEIKDNCPNAQLHVLTSPVGCEVLKLAPCVDRAWPLPLGPPSPPWWKHLSLLRTARRERFDVAFNFSGADRTLFVMFFLGARHSVASEGARKHFWKRWLAGQVIAREPGVTPVSESRRRMLAHCGFALKPPRFDL